MDEVRSGEVGSVLDLTGVSTINQVQQAALQSRLHIPVIFGLDVIHGYKTIFPVPLGEASTWDPGSCPRHRAGQDEADGKPAAHHQRRHLADELGGVRPVVPGVRPRRTGGRGPEHQVLSGLPIRPDGQPA
jgi:beta-glucosidase-like glycosyl hydrolase